MSSQDPEEPRGRAEIRSEARTRSWIRRIHFYLGLYFLLFIWLFSVSGLLLNNSHWRTARFWDERVETTREQEVRPLPAGDDIAVVRRIMTDLGLDGEINAVDRSAAETTFQVNRPGLSHRVEVDHETHVASVRSVEVNVAGVLSNLHTFSGVSMTDPSRVRDWTLTRIWSFAMDAIAVGLIVLVASGLYLWYQLPRKRVGGLISLCAGLVTCGAFLFALVRFV